LKTDENKILMNKKTSNNPRLGAVGAGGPTKRKAELDLKKSTGTKRAAFGDLTNAKQSSSNTSNLKTQVKKGLNIFVEKGKSSLRSQKTTGSKTKANENIKVKEEVIEEVAATSSSSEEALLCDLDASTGDGDSTLPLSEPEPQTFEVREPERSLPPDGVPDFDGETWGDPQQHSEYAMETFQYYKQRETEFSVPDYMSKQSEITNVMRAILVDWLVEVQESFELNHETLYTAVKMVDIYLSRKNVRKEDLQLVGAVACLIACKIDERIPPLVDDFLYVCDDAYSRDQLMKMERKMLAVIGFDLGFSLSYRYVRRYGRVCRVTMPTLTLARYILELSLMEYQLNIGTSEALLAAAALALAMKMKGISGWAGTMEYYSGFSLAQLDTTVQALLIMLQQPPKDNLKTVRSKYSHRVFHEVATIPVPRVVDMATDK